MDTENKGQKMYGLAKKIFPYCRSITGQGVRDTLKDLKDYIEEGGLAHLNIYSIPSGTEVFDWTVPKEWVIREAYIEDEHGKHIIDIRENNLHVMGYSISVDKWVNLSELKKHVFIQKDQQDVIPYVTSYYKEQYGFCMSEKQLSQLEEGNYHMYIDSEMIDGTLDYAEVILPGETDEEIFFSTYFCHPSMANNECSGPVLSAELVRYVAAMERRKYTYRFIYIPETIGAISYMSTSDHLRHMKGHIIAGFNLSCVGDDRDYSVVESKYADTLADKVMKNVLYFQTGGKYSTYSFLQRGSDERQYNAPGIELPVVCFCRSKFEEYPEYHTSADNMDLISSAGFQGSYEVMTKVIMALEYNEKYQITVLGEPQLGKRGLYPSISKKGNHSMVNVMLDFITYADGKNDLIDISNRINVSVGELINILIQLKDNNLIK